jgi:hypothetical protein
MLELAADNREVAQGKGDRSTSTSAHIDEPTQGRGALNQQRGGQSTAARIVVR